MLKMFCVFKRGSSKPNSSSLCRLYPPMVLHATNFIKRGFFVVDHRFVFFSQCRVFSAYGIFRLDFIWGAVSDQMIWNN